MGRFFFLTLNLYIILCIFLPFPFLDENPSSLKSPSPLEDVNSIFIVLLDN